MVSVEQLKIQRSWRSFKRFIDDVLQYLVIYNCTPFWIYLFAQINVFVIFRGVFFKHRSHNLKFFSLFQTFCFLFRFNFLPRHRWSLDFLPNFSADNLCHCFLIDWWRTIKKVLLASHEVPQNLRKPHIFCVQRSPYPLKFRTGNQSVSHICTFETISKGNASFWIKLSLAYIWTISLSFETNT